MQLFELFEIKFGLQPTQFHLSKEAKIWLATQLKQTPVYLAQLVQLTPHERQVLLVPFKYFPVGQTISAMQVLFLLL